jgi:hypothetical protein
MKSLPTISFLTFTILIILTPSCKKDEVETKADPYQQLCTPTADFYFRGTINGENKCWNLGENGYQLYLGGTTSGTGSDIINCWTQGLDQWPVPETNEVILINTETNYAIETCTRDQFFNSYIPGTYPIVHIADEGTLGIDIIYRINQSSYTTRTGPQGDSCYIQLVEAIKTPDVGNTDQIDLTYRFSCNLYACQGAYFGRISAGELKVRQTRTIYN